MRFNIVVGCLVLATASACSGQVVLSQRSIHSHNDPLDFGQSFTAPSSFELGALRLSVSASMGGSDVTARFYRFDRTTLTLGPTAIASGTFLERQLGGTPNWIEIPLSPVGESTPSRFKLMTEEAIRVGIITAPPSTTCTAAENSSTD